MGRGAKRLAMAVLVLTSALFAYGLLEAGMHLTVTRWPMWMYNAQCRELRTLGQTSKSAATPQPPYLAIIGDSYGSGQGDWFAENGYNLNSRYHAANVLQDLTGRDVLSLSRAGAGNYDGAAIYAVNTYRLLNKLGFGLQAPDALVVYFYEGNDLSDNLRFKDRHYAPAYDLTQVYDDAYFARFALDMEQKHCQGTFRELQDRFFAGNLLSRTVEGVIYSLTKHPKAPAGGSPHTAVVGGQTVALPASVAEDDLMHMAENDKRLGVRFFERALFRVAQVWPQARRHVVYIPAPLSLYGLAGPEGPSIRAASADLERRVAQAAAQNGFAFISATDTLRGVAAGNLIHGPTDWNHLNRKGYTALGELLGSRVHVD